jgi:signal recognition particle GTPase
MALKKGHGALGVGRHVRTPILIVRRTLESAGDGSADTGVWDTAGRASLDASQHTTKKRDSG